MKFRWPLLAGFATLAALATLAVVGLSFSLRSEAVTKPPGRPCRHSLARGVNPGTVLAVFVEAAILRREPWCARDTLTDAYLAQWPEAPGIPVAPFTSKLRVGYLEKCRYPKACWSIPGGTHPAPNVYELKVLFGAPDVPAVFYEIRLVLTDAGWRVDYAQAVSQGGTGPAAA